MAVYKERTFQWLATGDSFGPSISTEKFDSYAKIIKNVENPTISYENSYQLQCQDTQKELANKNEPPNSAYSSEATKTELLTGTLVDNKDNINVTDPSANNSISVAKLPNNIEKQHGNGEKIVILTNKPRIKQKVIAKHTPPWLSTFVQ